MYKAGIGRKSDIIWEAKVTDIDYNTVGIIIVIKNDHFFGVQDDTKSRFYIEKYLSVLNYLVPTSQLNKLFIKR